jgi:hypothetical protein
MKQRVAHYDLSGRYLGSVEGVEDAGWDVALVDQHLYVLDDQASGRIGVDPVGGRFRFSNVTLDRERVSILQIFSSPLGLMGQADSDEGELGRFLQIAMPGSAEARLLPGLPYGRGDAFFQARWSESSQGDQDFDLLFLAPVRPLRVDLIAHEHGKAISVPAEVALTEPLPVGHDVLFLVKIAPTRPDDAERYGGGRWLLRVGSSPLLWERLPYPETLDELQHRHLAVGPDGGIYLMLVGRGGEHILRRPSTGP